MGLTWWNRKQRCTAREVCGHSTFIERPLTAHNIEHKGTKLVPKAVPSQKGLWNTLGTTVNLFFNIDTVHVNRNFSKEQLDLNNILNRQSRTNSLQAHVSLPPWISCVQICIGHFVIFTHGIMYFKTKKNIWSFQYNLFTKTTGYRISLLRIYC